MKSNNGATRQDVVVNSVDHQVSGLTNSAASTGQLETLLISELDHDLIAWPRQYLETYLDSDATGRVPLDAEQLQDILEAAFDRDAALAREYLEELNGERRPKTLGDTTLQIAIARTEREKIEYELLFDPADSQDLRYLIEKLDIRAQERHKAQSTPALETQSDTERRETTTTVTVHQPGSGAVELHDKTTGTDVRKLLGGGELPRGLQSALTLRAADARVEHAQTDSGTYRGRIIADTEKNLVQQINSHTAVIHRKELLDMIPTIGENVRVAYSYDHARVLPVRERTRKQELER
ncbi:MAG TPA: hypothetical protein VNZ03_29640 [Terriglobales bacterium]|jgi:hypothetical protein|nr:hypothetical protein [Terriglobales bacterium]